MRNGRISKSSKRVLISILAIVCIASDSAQLTNFPAQPYDQTLFTNQYVHNVVGEFTLFTKIYGKNNIALIIDQTNELQLIYFAGTGPYTISGTDVTTLASRGTILIADKYPGSEAIYIW